MRRFNLLFGIFVLSLFVIPGFKANAATEVSNEEQLRAIKRSFISRWRYCPKEWNRSKRYFSY